MPAFILAAIDVEDRNEFNRYVEMSARAVAVNDIKVEALFHDEPQLLDGQLPAQHIMVMKFKSLKDAKKFYYSEEYQKAAFVRHGSARTAFSLIVEGELNKIGRPVRSAARTQASRNLQNGGVKSSPWKAQKVTAFA